MAAVPFYVVIEKHDIPPALRATPIEGGFVLRFAHGNTAEREALQKIPLRRGWPGGPGDVSRAHTGCITCSEAPSTSPFTASR